MGSKQATAFRLSLLVLLSLLGVAAASAGQSAIPAAFLDIGLDARVMGMGGAGSAGTGRVADLVWNPAGLAILRRSEITAMQTEQFGLVPAYFLAATRRQASGLGLGAGVLSSGDGLLRENTLFLALGRMLPGAGGMALGLTLKARHASFGPETGGEGVDGSAYGAALDLGLRGGHGALSYGLVVEELFSDLRWSSSAVGSYHEGVPPTCSLGFIFEGGALELAGDLEVALDEERAHKAALGLEWRPFSLLEFRGGLKQRLDAEAQRFLTMGLGIGHDQSGGGRLQLDSAYLFHELGNSLRISAGYGF